MISICESKQEVDQIENKIHHLFCLIFEHYFFSQL
jgi:hypothetical protein